MANDIANRNTGTEIDPYEQLGNESGSREHIHGELLKFTKHGDYKCGQEQALVEEGTRMLAHMPSLKKGWVKWFDNQPVQHILGLVRECYQPPTREQLGDLDQANWPLLGDRKIDPWQLTFYLVMLDDTGQLYTFVTGSKGGKDAISDLSRNYAMHRKMKPEEIPIVKLEAKSYIHREFGETFKPLLTLDGWSKIPNDFDELSTALAPSEENIETEEFLPKSTSVKAVPQIEKAKAKVKPKAPPPPPPRGKGKNGPGKGVSRF